jgi:hypothetical protein
MTKKVGKVPGMNREQAAIMTHSNRIARRRKALAQRTSRMAKK